MQLLGGALKQKVGGSYLGFLLFVWMCLNAKSTKTSLQADAEDMCLTYVWLLQEASLSGISQIPHMAVIWLMRDVW